MILEQHPEIGRLSTDDKLQLIQELYTAMEADHELEPNPAVVAELQRRIAEHERSGEPGVTWDELRQKVTDDAWRK